MKFAWLIPILLLSFIAQAEVTKTISEPIMTNGKGRVTCAGGGTQSPLFNRECKKLSIQRVFTPGAIKYEMTCTDSSNVTFQLACDAYALEQVLTVF